MEFINYSNLRIKGIKPKLMIFPDTEFKIVLKSIPKAKIYVIIVQTDEDPSKKIFITAQIIEILKQNDPEKIIVVHPWLSFSRQDKRFFEMEPLSINIVLNLYLSLGATDLIALDIHSIDYRKPGIYSFNSPSGTLKIHNVNYVSQFYKENMHILSPTGTDEPFLEPLRKKNIPISYFKKEKYCKNCNQTLQYCQCEGDVVPDIRIISDQEFTGENILVLDDIIASGGTILSTIKQLKNAGASKIFVGVTHGFFNNVEKALEILELSDLVMVSNSVKIPEILLSRIQVTDTASYLYNYINNL